MQEELEVRLEESSLPAPEWIDYDGKSSSGLSADGEKSSSKIIPYPSGHVKLELEGTCFTWPEKMNNKLIEKNLSRFIVFFTRLVGVEMMKNICINYSFILGTLTFDS